MAEEIQLDAINKTLSEISRKIYGDRVELRYLPVASIEPTDRNARFMKESTFSQLVKNLEKDQILESIPLCHQKKNKSVELISGNHRVMAAKSAGIKNVLALVIPHELAISKKRAKQLAHNEIVGEDDKSILRELWKEIDNLNDKIYTGFDSIKIEELESINFGAISTPSINTEVITLYFLPNEIKETRLVMEEIEKFVTSKEIWILAIESYQDAFNLLIKMKKRCNIINNTVAFMKIIDLAKERMEQIEQEEKEKDNAQVA